MAIDHHWPVMADDLGVTDRAAWGSVQSAMQPWTGPANEIDQKLYNATVLQLSSTTSEDDLDDRVTLEAQSLGLLPLSTTSDMDGIMSALTTGTMTSDPIIHGSAQSQSTAPTSCASSEQLPAMRSSFVSETSLKHSEPPSPRYESNHKSGSPLARGFRKMAGFRRKRSTITPSPTLTNIGDVDTSHSENTSIDMKSPLSVKSSKSSWSRPLSPPKLSYEQAPLVDEEALKRSMECKTMLTVRMAQLDEKSRFLEFQVFLMSQLRAEREKVKAQRRVEHEQILAAQAEKDDRAVEDFEARQLEDEMKMEQEHTVEKRTVMVRLRHMEAYCRNPTPPVTAVGPDSGRVSMDSALPGRKVTDKDYHNLAQQYRERDAMDTLHASKINVLRGKQKKAVESLILRKSRELEALEKRLEKELDPIDRDFATQETDLKLALGVKRVRLEARWKTQALIERTRMEKATGAKYAGLPDVLAVDDSSAIDMTM